MKSKYKIDSMPFYKLSEKVNIPKFQRGLVWNFDKQREFIHTVLSGNPFGALLLYQDELTTVSLIDGLQRYSTLKKFAKTPLIYVNILDYCKEDLNNIAKTIIIETKINGNHSEIKNSLQSEIKEHFSLELSPENILDEVMKSLPFLNDINMQTYRQLNIIIANLKASLDISNLEIPYIMFEGDFDELPAIFEEMNSTGTKLTKYDIYSAKWCDQTFSLSDTTLLALIDEKYRAMIEDADTDVSGYNIGDIFKTKTVNLYEYCYAVGKVLKEKCPNILATPQSKGNTIETLGFLLISAILLKTTKSIHAIPACFKGATSDELRKFKDKIVDCAVSVDNILAEYINIPNGSRLLRYIESQMTCIIATLFNIRFAKDGNRLAFTPNPLSSKYTGVFKMCMPQRYLYDIVTDYWSGNGDKRLADELNKNLKDNRYLSPIHEATWRSALQDLVDDQIHKPMKKIPVVNKLILNYLLRYRAIPAKLGKNMEVDYVIPKNKFSKQNHTFNGIAALGNLLIFPQFENRSKSDQTWYEYIRNKTTLATTDESMLESLMYPDHNELAFVNAHNTFTPENYARFLKDRHNYFINKFIEYYVK